MTIRISIGDNSDHSDHAHRSNKQQRQSKVYKEITANTRRIEPYPLAGGVKEKLPPPRAPLNEVLHPPLRFFRLFQRGMLRETCVWVNGLMTLGWNLYIVSNLP